MLNLAQLKKALEPIQNMSKAESKMTLSGVDIHVRILTPQQDFAVQSESQGYLSELQEGDTADRIKILAYIDEFRIQTLTRCIVQVGDLDLRTVSFIETGEHLENGTAIKISKEKALREILQGWNRAMQVAILEHYNALVAKIDKETGVSVEGDFADETSELNYLKNRVEELEKKEQKKQIEQENDVRNTFRTVVETSKTSNDQETLEKSAQAYLDQEREQAPREPENSPRKPIFPNQSVPPQQVATPTPPPPQTITPTPPPSQEDSMFFQEQEFPSKPNEQKDGIDVYRLPTQTLGADISPTQPTQTISSSKNPRFVSPPKP